MDYPNQSAVLQQLASVPGVQERLRKLMGMNSALGVINQNAVLPNQPQSEFALGPEFTSAIANQRYNDIQALPYETGPGQGQAWPGSPEWNGPINQDPRIKEILARYMQTKPAFAVPQFQLPQAPPLQ